MDADPRPHLGAPSHFHPTKILVFRGGALGDFLVTLPALALLRQRWPEAHIELVGNVTAAQLARARGLLDAVHSQHDARWGALFADTPLPDALAAWLAGFDLVVNYWPDADGELRRRFPMRPGQMFLSAEALPACAPAAAHYCEPLRALGLVAHDYCYRLAPVVAARVSERTSVASPLAHARSCIAIHPGSGSPRKNWPAENWLALIDRLPSPVSFIIGEAEVERWSRGALAAEFAQHAARAPRSPEVLVNAPLEELVAHFAQCRLFLGHDSGISHLAALSGVPCVLLFGPTAPSVWAPPARDVRVLQRDAGLSSISVEDVHRAAAAVLADQT